MNNANTTKNGLTGVLAYLITSVSGYVQDYSNSTFFTRIDDHTGFISIGGKYRFDWSANIQDTNCVFYFQTSSSQTSGYTPIIQPTTANGASPVFSEFHGIVQIPANTYLMLNRASIPSTNAPF